MAATNWRTGNPNKPQPDRTRQRTAPNGKGQPCQPRPAKDDERTVVKRGEASAHPHGTRAHAAEGRQQETAEPTGGPPTPEPRTCPLSYNGAVQPMEPAASQPSSNWSTANDPSYYD